MEKWTKEEEEKLKQMAIEGSSLFEIAQNFKRTPMAIILRTRKISGLEKEDRTIMNSRIFSDQTKTIQELAPNRMRKWSDADKIHVQRMFDEGKSIREIANFYDRTDKSIIMLIENMNKSADKKQILFNKAKFLIGKKKSVLIS